MAVDTDQLNARRLQWDGESSGPDAEIEHRRYGGTSQLQPGPQVGGIGQTRIQLRKSGVGPDGVVSDDGQKGLGDSLVGDIERPVDDGEALSQLVLVDAQRRVRHDGVPVDERVQATLTEKFTDGL